ncbi:MAG: trypsin-like serine protease [Oscillospiraceae bacterium]|nr:trypsin-like serine protease [Oscillospiraceae bacterium]
MKMNLFRKVKVFLLVGLAVAMLSTPAYGTEVDIGTDQSGISSIGGTYCKNAVTGETYYIPEPDIEAQSDETFGFSPGYNPFADEENDADNSLQPYYLESGRTPVKNPQYNEKCRNTVYIETKYKGKDNFELTGIGTGFIIGPNAIATAGHNLFDKDTISGDHWITESTIIPAYNSGSDQQHFKSAKGIAYRCGGGWANNGDFADDWGIIILDWNIGNDTGWLGLQWQSSPYSSGTSVEVNGYPVKIYDEYTQIPRDQYTRRGTVGAVPNINMLESRDIFISSGDSGGPCYIDSPTYGYTAIGITSCYKPYDEDGKNLEWVRFRTIDKSLYTKLIEFRTSTL